MSGDTFRQLAALGLTMDQIAGVLDIMDGQAKDHAALEEVRKAKVRARVQKWRAKKSVTLPNVTERYDTLRNGSRAEARGEDNLLPEEISGKEENKKEVAPAVREDGRAAFRSELPEIDEDRFTALMAHRKTKKAALSRHAAKMFRRDAAACGMSIIDAVDACISRNWVTVKPEYFAGKQHGTGPPRKRNYADVAVDHFAGAGHGSEDVFGNHSNVELFPPKRGQPRPDHVDIPGGIAGRFLPSRR